MVHYSRLRKAPSGGHVGHIRESAATAHRWARGKLEDMKCGLWSYLLNAVSFRSGAMHGPLLRLTRGIWLRGECVRQVHNRSAVSGHDMRIRHTTCGGWMGKQGLRSIRTT